MYMDAEVRLDLLAQRFDNFIHHSPDDKRAQAINRSLAQRPSLMRRLRSVPGVVDCRAQMRQLVHLLACCLGA